MIRTGIQIGVGQTGTGILTGIGDRTGIQIGIGDRTGIQIGIGTRTGIQTVSTITTMTGEVVAEEKAGAAEEEDEAKRASLLPYPLI
jgi:hypothetical protein